MPAPSFVNAGSKASTGFGTSVTPTLPGSRVNDNLLIAIVGNGATDGKTFTFPGDWTPIDAFADTHTGFAAAYRFVDGTEGNPEITWTGNTSAQAQVFQYNGTVSGASAIGNKAENHNTSTSNTVTHPGLETGANNSLVLAFVYMQNGTMGGTPDNYTEAASTSNLAGYHMAVASSGDSSDAISQTESNTEFWRCLQIELRSEAAVVEHDLAADFTDDAGVGASLTVIGEVIPVTAVFTDSNSIAFTALLTGGNIVRRVAALFADDAGMAAALTVEEPPAVPPPIQAIVVTQ